MQTLIIPPQLLWRKMIISQLELRPPGFSTYIRKAGDFIENLTYFRMMIILTAGAWAPYGFHQTHYGV